MDIYKDYVEFGEAESQEMVAGGMVRWNMHPQFSGLLGFMGSKDYIDDPFLRDGMNENTVLATPRRSSQTAFAEGSWIAYPGNMEFHGNIAMGAADTSNARSMRAVNQEFKTGTATAAIRGTKGFIGGEKGFVGSLKEGKLEITSTKSGRKFAIGAGETAVGRDSLVVLKLSTSGSPSLAKALTKVAEDTTLTIDQIVEAAKVADSSIAAKENAPLDEESMKVSSVSSEVCSGGLKIEGSYRTAVSTASLVVKIGSFVSENLATSTDGKTHTFSVSVPVTDENKLWTLNSADVVLTAGEKVFAYRCWY